MHFPSSKTIISMHHKSEVYDIPCNNFELSYINQSQKKSPLVKKITVLKNCIKKQLLCKAAVVTQSWQKHLVMNFSDTKTLHMTQYVNKLEFLECLSIY